MDGCGWVIDETRTLVADGWYPNEKKEERNPANRTHLNLVKFGKDIRGASGRKVGHGRCKGQYEKYWRLATSICQGFWLVWLDYVEVFL